MAQVHVLITRINPTVPLPAYANGGDAGADLTTTIDFTLAGGASMVPTESQCAT